MAPEQNPLPAWAQRERWTDLSWIAQHLPAFHPVARAAYDAWGRGALVINTTVQVPERGHPFTYALQEEIARYEDKDIDRLVAEYVPDNELVVVLLKTEGRTSAYRVRSGRPPGPTSGPEGP